MMQKILIVEDDEKLRNELKIFLEKNGYKVEVLETFKNTIEHILNIKPDIVLLDINLPNVDGQYVCKEIRKTSNMGIIMVTSRDSEIDELLSINYGADHYITKPYNIQILLAKIASLLRRTNASGEISDKIDAKDFIINTSNSTIEKQGKIIELTKNEYKILKYLGQYRGKMVSREEIMDCLWETESFIDDNTLTVNITRLRNKFRRVKFKRIVRNKKRARIYIKINNLIKNIAILC